MSKRLEVLAAVKALVQSALPHAKVIGLDGEDAAPMRVPPTGMVVVRSGDPGEPEVDLCPPVYHYTHRIPIEVSAYETTAKSGEEVVDEMMGRIGAVVEVDRTLGGRCDWLEPTGPNTDDIYTEAATPARGGDFDLLDLYDASVDGTPIDLEFGWKRGATSSLIFTVPRVFLPRVKRPFSGPGGIQATSNWQASGAGGHTLTAVLTNDVASY